MSINRLRIPRRSAPCSRQSFSLLCISGGKFSGAKIVFQVDTTNWGRPPSIVVGTLGMMSARSGLAIAIVFSVPLLICEKPHSTIYN